MPAAFRRFASPFTLVVAICALGSAIAAVPVGGGTAAMLLGDQPAGFLIIAMLTALLSGLVVAAALRTKWFLVCALAPAGGALVAMLSLFVVLGLTRVVETGGTEELTAANAGWQLASTLIFGVYAAVIGGVVGTMFGACLLVPVAVGAWYLRRPSLDGGARAGLVCAPWLAGVSALGFTSLPADKWCVGVALAALGLVAALAVGGASVVHVVVVRSFLGRVRRGAEGGYRIRAFDVRDDPSSLLVFASAPMTWKRVAVLESFTLDALAYRSPPPAFRALALVSQS